MAEHGPHQFHDQPAHLEDVINDVNEELFTTSHGLSFGATSLLRFLATTAWTSKSNHPEWYATINPRFARTKAMAQATGGSQSSMKRYLAELEKARFIRREHQYGPDGYRIEDRIWMLWTDQDRKTRKDSYRDITEVIEDSFHVIGEKKTFDNRYWVNPRTGQFWRFDNPKHKVADDEVEVTLTAEESRFFWNKMQPLNTTQRRKIMERLATEGRRGHVWLRSVAADFDRKVRYRKAS
jgi:hypothetical protein